MHPILIDFHGLKVYSYGFMMVVAYFFAIGFIYFYAPKVKMDRNDAIDMSIIAFISGILGSRVLYVILNIKKYYGHWTGIFEFQKGGLSWHGGLLGGVLAIAIYSKVKGYSITKSMDLILTPAIAGLGIGRIGCFLNGCCYGKACSLPWAMVFPHHRHPIPVHPTQIYEMILDFAAFGFLLYWWNKRKFDGENSLVMAAIYSVIRFVVESFRYNTPDQMIHGLSLAQWFSLAAFIILVPLIIYLRKHAKPMEDVSPEDEKRVVPPVKISEETEENIEKEGNQLSESGNPA